MLDRIQFVAASGCRRPLHGVLETVSTLRTSSAHRYVPPRTGSRDGRRDVYGGLESRHFGSWISLTRAGFEDVVVFGSLTNTLDRLSAAKGSTTKPRQMRRAGSGVAGGA